MKNYERAYQDYLNGMKYKDIAEKYEVSVSAVKSWKKRYWSDAKKVKKVATKKKKVASKKVAKKIAEKMIEDDKGLSEEQELFCIYFLKYHNASKAYLKVNPDVTYGSAMVMGSRWKNDPVINKRINQLKKDLYVDALLDPHDIVQKYIDIAFADMTDFVEFKGGWVSLKKSDYVDGSLIQEIRELKDGVAIKLSDRMKALEWLSKHMDMMTKEQRIRIEVMEEKMKSLKNDDENETLDKVNQILEGIKNAAE